MRAPDFPKKSTWFNAPHPLTWGELQGHVILLDFWTYCCVNCMHTLPILRRIEEEFAGEPFQVIGIHSGKFDQENDAENIRKAISRLSISHPCLVDRDHEYWNQLSVRSWPTLVLVDSQGQIVESLAGEPDAPVLRDRIAGLLEQERVRGNLAKKRKTFTSIPKKQDSPLWFPGKVRIFPRSIEQPKDLLAISDTGNHRLILADLEGDEEGWPRVTSVETVGGGGVGDEDGEFGKCSFSGPQGVDREGSTLYVCDTGNHLLRQVDLATRKVWTVAGNGQLHTTRHGGGPLDTALRSPWDVRVVPGAALIAMAGAHQIWAYDFSEGTVFSVIGNGTEDHVDGGFGECALAQPSSLMVVGNGMLFVDSETSSVRIADFRRQMVMTLVGKGLFDFGDLDGKLDESLLAHPLGAVFVERTIFVADTYNNKLKEIDLDAEVCTTFLGDGQPATLDEPGGLDTHNGLLYVADTNNHRIRVVRVNDGAVRTLAMV